MICPADDRCGCATSRPGTSRVRAAPRARGSSQGSTGPAVGSTGSPRSGPRTITVAALLRSPAPSTTRSGPLRSGKARPRASMRGDRPGRRSRTSRLRATGRERAKPPGTSVTCAALSGRGTGRVKERRPGRSRRPGGTASGPGPPGASGPARRHTALAAATDAPSATAGGRPGAGARLCLASGAGFRLPGHRAHRRKGPVALGAGSVSPSSAQAAAATRRPRRRSRRVAVARGGLPPARRDRRRELLARRLDG